MLGSLLMLLFWGLVIVLVVYIANSSSNKNRNLYNRGYNDGYKSAIEIIKAKIKNNQPIEVSELDSLMGLSPVAPSANRSMAEAQVNTQPQPVSLTQEATTQSSHSNTAMQLTDQPKNDVLADMSANQLAPPPDPQVVKTANTMRNLNILLGLSSLLFVAAGIAFIASPLPDITKLLGVIIIMILFYGGGMGLYIWSSKLKPAGVSFIGTGLALMPFVAIALNIYGGIPSQWAWFLVSVSGVVAYGAATLILQSQVVAYLTIGFLLSFVGSMLTVSGTVLIWYFVSFIGMSLILSVISALAPRWLPAVFKSSVAFAGQSIAPLTLIASLLLFGRLEVWHYELLTGLVASHYFVAWLQSKHKVYIHLARALAQVTVMIVWFDIAKGNLGNLAMGWVVISTLHQLVSLAVTYIRKSSSGHQGYSELIWATVQFVLQTIILPLWIGHPNWSIYLTIFSAIWLAVGLLSAFIHRTSGFLVVAIISSLVLPWLVLRGLPNLNWPLWTVGLIHLLGVGIGLAMHRFVLLNHAKSWRAMGVASVVSHSLLTFILLWSVKEPSAGIVLSLLLVILIITSSHIYQKPWSILGLLLAVHQASYFIGQVSNLSGQDAVILSAFSAVFLSSVITAVYAVINDQKRTVLMLAISNILVIPLAVSLLSANTLLEPELSRIVSLLLLMLGISLNLIIKLFTKEPITGLRLVTILAYLVFFVLGLPISFLLAEGWLAGLLALGIILVMELSYSENKSGLTFVMSPLLYWLVANVVSWLPMTRSWRLFITVAIVGLLLYACHWLFMIANDNKRRWYTLISAWIVIFGGTLIVSIPYDTRLASALLMLVGAITIAVDGWLMTSRARSEVAGYIGVIALSIMISCLWPLTDGLVYHHMWVAMIMLMAWWRTDTSGSARTVRAVIAMSILTGSVGLEALASGDWYSLIFLIEHVAILVIGAIISRTWVVRWGAITSALAVVYYMRESPYLLFALLGVAIIGFVIWRLRRIK